MKAGQAKLRRGPGRRVRARSRGGAGADPDEAPSFAALDLGTNNCRLLVARPAGTAFRVVDAFSRIVRLGEGLDRRGRLSEAAMDRTIEALKVCAAKMARKHVVCARSVATEACRRAANCGDFLERVRSRTGLDLEIIATDEEARLALLGCAPLLVEGQPYAIVFDIGGGSTEIMWVERTDDAPARLLDSLSVPLGVVNLSETFGGDRLEESQFSAMVDLAADALAVFETRNAIASRVAAGTVQMLGTSGTVTTLAGVHMGLRAYDRNLVDGSYLDFNDVALVTRRLLALDCAGRATEPCIGTDRADLVLAGCAILEAVCRAWPVGRLRVADRGLREGILLTLMGRDTAVAGAA